MSCYKVLHRDGKIHLFPRKNFKAEEYWKLYNEWQKSIPGISMRRASELSGHPYERFRQGVRNHQIVLNLRSKGELPDT